MTKRTWFTAALAEGNPAAADIAIYDTIGMFGIGAGEFRDQLQALGNVQTINLRVSSDGGDPFVAYAIGAMMQRHPAKVVATVDGVAASAATLITSLADEVQMPANAMMMVHDPAALMIGAFNAAELRSEVDALTKLSASMKAVYAAKTGKTADEIAPLLATNTWLTAEEAKAIGLADVVLPARQVQARIDLSNYPNAPAAALALARVETPDASTVTGADADGNGDSHATEALALMRSASDLIAKGMAALTGGQDEAANAAATATATRRPDPEAAEEAARAETQRAADIKAACDVAKVGPEVTGLFLASGKSLDEVRAALQTIQASRAGGEVNSRHQPSDGAPASWGKVIDRVNGAITP